jgi:hypothetical protein
LRADELFGVLGKLIRAQAVSVFVDHKVLPLYETLPLQLVVERDVIRSGTQAGCQAPETVDSIFLLRADHPRREGHGGEERDELAPPHSITSSARASSDGGTPSLSALAVFRLMTNSNLVGS